MTLSINENTPIEQLQSERRKIREQYDYLRQQKKALLENIVDVERQLEHVNSLLSKKQQTNLFTNNQ